MKLVFATENRGKLNEARAILPHGYEIITLGTLPDAVLPEETKNTLEGNALLKAKYLHNTFNMPCFADDTGLFIHALDGGPGVQTARYAGANATDLENMELVLQNLLGAKDRGAYFKTIIALIISGKEVLFEGLLHGTITDEIRGSGGFGYDPIFMPDGYNITLGAMKPKEKNAISHRRKALLQMAQFLG